MVDCDEVWEKWQDVLNLDKFTLLQEMHRLLDVVLLPHHMFGYEKTVSMILITPTGINQNSKTCNPLLQ